MTMMRHSTVALLIMPLLLLLAAAQLGAPQPAPISQPDEGQHAHQHHASGATRTPLLARRAVCPEPPVAVAPGTELSALAPNATYLLPAGTYTINSTIILDTDATTCFQGQGPTRESVQVHVIAGASNPGPLRDNRAFQVSNLATLGLQGLVLDGDSVSTGVYASRGSLDVTDVTFQNFLKVTLVGVSGGAAVHLGAEYPTTAAIADAIFYNNTCIGCLGGALEGGEASVALGDVRWEANTGHRGGAMHMYQPGGLVIAYGAQTFTQNTAVINGGAIYNQGASLSFNGPLCAQGNVAPSALFLQSDYFKFTAVEFRDPANSFIDGTIVNDGFMQCSGGGDWRQATFTITGGVCACSSAFADGTNTTCNSCALGWSSDTCSCRACVPNSGPCCDASGRFRGNQTICRPRASTCGTDTTCNGTHAGCPDPTNRAEGSPCYWRVSTPWADSFMVDASNAQRMEVSTDEALGVMQLTAELQRSYHVGSSNVCRGKCTRGRCVMTRSARECCRARHADSLAEYQAQLREEDAVTHTLTPEPAAKPQASSYYRGRQDSDEHRWYCWRQ